MMRSEYEGNFDTWDKIDYRECDAIMEFEENEFTTVEQPCTFKDDVLIDYWNIGARWVCPDCDTEHDEDPREWQV